MTYFQVDNKSFITIIQHIFNLLQLPYSFSILTICKSQLFSTVINKIKRLYNINDITGVSINNSHRQKYILSIKRNIHTFTLDCLIHGLLQCKFVSHLKVCWHKYLDTRNWPSIMKLFFNEEADLLIVIIDFLWENVS